MLRYTGDCRRGRGIFRSTAVRGPGYPSILLSFSYFSRIRYYLDCAKIFQGEMTIRARLFNRFAGRMLFPFTVFPSATNSASSVSICSAFCNLNLRSSGSTTVIGSTSSIASMEDIFKQKKALRSKIKKELKSMDPILRCREDDAIQNLVLEAPWFKSCRRLCAYISCAALREVDTSKVLSHILEDSSQATDPEARKKLYVPRAEDKNSFMRMLNIRRTDDLISNSMNILEPAPYDSTRNVPEDVMFANEPVDLILIPGVAFDKTGMRLGRGGGYYDAFLKKYADLAKERNWRKPLFVALSYSIQIVDPGVIPATPSDVPVDAIISPSGIIPVENAASPPIMKQPPPSGLSPLVPGQ